MKQYLEQIKLNLAYKSKKEIKKTLEENGFTIITDDIIKKRASVKQK
jgi:hypothetical protein